MEIRKPELHGLWWPRTQHHLFFLESWCPTAPGEPSPNTTTATSPTTQPWLLLQTVTFPSPAAISRGEKGPLLALSPNLSKELIFKAISPQQSKFWFTSCGDSWAPLTGEMGSVGWMGSAPGGTSAETGTQTTAGATTTSLSLGNPNLPYFLL